MKKLPKRIYVKRETDPSDHSVIWLVADSTIDSVDAGEVVGIYELVEVRTMRVSKELV